jgi:hypothetical protein
MATANHPFEHPDLVLMSNIRPKLSGIEGVVIWTSAGELSGTEPQYGPRIKVVLGDRINVEGLNDAVTVRISEPPVVLGELPSKVQRGVVQFVEKNTGGRLRHWNRDLDSRETLVLLEPVGDQQ